MVIFHSYVSLPEGISLITCLSHGYESEMHFVIQQTESERFRSSLREPVPALWQRMICPSATEKICELLCTASHSDWEDTPSSLRIAKKVKEIQRFFFCDT